MNCDDCRERLHAFLDGELSGPAAEELGASAQEIAQHLDDCPACFERSRVEDAFSTTIRRLGTAEGAPAALAGRIRAALDQGTEDAHDAPEPGAETARVPVASWLRRGLAAAAVMLAGVLALQALLPWGGGTGAGEAVFPAFVRGELVCLDCIMAKAAVRRDVEAEVEPARIDPDPGAHHPLRLRSEDGRIWELHGRDEDEELLAVHDNAGRRVTVVGTAYPKLGVVRVARVNPR